MPPVLCTGHANSRKHPRLSPGPLRGRLIPPKIQIPSDSLNRVSQGPQDLQELRASREFAAMLAPPGHRGTEGLQVCLGSQDRR